METPAGDRFWRIEGSDINRARRVPSVRCDDEATGGEAGIFRAPARAIVRPDEQSRQRDNLPWAEQTGAMTVPVEVRNNALIAMTVPVQTAQQNGGTVMRFYLPAKYSRDRAPEPADAQVKIVLVPAETIAVVRFSGSGEDFAAHQTELLEMLRGSRWRPTGAPYTLYYDAPFTLPFLRRNEAAVPVLENL